MPISPLLRLAAPLAVLLVAAGPAVASSLAEARFAERVVARNAELRLHAVGVLRTRIVFEAYVAALYLGEGVTPERVLADVPRRLEIEYFWPIPADAFARATLEGISRNVDARTLASLQERIERVNRLYRDVRPGDRYALTYVPGAGTELALNGEPRGSIDGADFAAALFSIWLGDEPFDASLKDQLLGRS
jgi:hypothetical protein